MHKLLQLLVVLFRTTRLWRRLRVLSKNVDAHAPTLGTKLQRLRRVQNGTVTRSGRQQHQRMVGSAQGTPDQSRDGGPVRIHALRMQILVQRLETDGNLCCLQRVLRSRIVTTTTDAGTVAVTRHIGCCCVHEFTAYQIQESKLTDPDMLLLLLLEVLLDLHLHQNGGAGGMGLVVRQGSRPRRQRALHRGPHVGGTEAAQSGRTLQFQLEWILMMMMMLLRVGAVTAAAAS